MKLLSKVIIFCCLFFSLLAQDKDLSLKYEQAINLENGD